MFEAIAKRRSRFNSRSNRACLKQRQGFRLRRVGLEMLEPRRVLSAVSWTGGGGDNSWDNTANWSGGALPGPADDVTINPAVSLTVTHASGSDSIHSLISQVPIAVSGGSLAIASTSTINATLLLSGAGVLAGSGDLTSTNFTWTGGTIQGTGDVDITGSAALVSGDMTLDGRNLNNFGTVNWGAGDIHLVNGAVVNNEPGAIFDVAAFATLMSDGSGAFNNAGNLVATSTLSSIRVPFNNTGHVDVQRGELSIAGGVTSTGGTFVSEADAFLEFGVTSIDSASSISGAGKVQFATGSATIAGTYNITGTTLVRPNAGDTVIFSGNVQSVGALTIQEHVTFNPTTATAVAAQSINLNGTLDGTASFNVAGNYVQSSSGVLDIAIGGSTPVSQFNQIQVGGAATLAGTLNVSLANGFSPPVNSAFQVLTFGSRNGSMFGTISGLTAANLTSNYDATSLTLKSTVVTVPLTVTVQPSTKTYGDANPMFTVTYAGFVAGDDPSVLGGHLMFSTPADPSSPVGNYVVTASGLTSDKYTFIYVSGNLAVTPASLTVNVNNTTWAIGTPFPPPFTVSYSGFVLGQNASVLGGTLAFSTTANQNSTVGDYPVSASGLTSTNYAITYVNGTLSVIVDSNLGILLLDPTGKGTLTVSGNGSASVTGGEIVVDSSSTQAVKVTGNGQVSAVEIDTKGVSTSGHGKVQGVIDTADPSMADPLAGLAAPSIPTTVQSSSTLNITGNSQMTLQPGLYIGGIKITGQAQVMLAPGIYYLKGGGFSVTGQARVSGTDVLLYNAPAKSSDTISFTGQGEIDLTGLYGGAYQGMVIFQDRTSTAAISLTGQGNVNLVGTVYAAGATLNLTGNGSLNLTGDAQRHLADHLIVADLQITGNGGVSVDLSGNALPPDGVDYYFANY
jgi:MBG domain (YGX type)